MRDLKTFPITDAPNAKRTAQNNVETFNIKWTNKSGNPRGNGRNSVAAAQELARKVEGNGATDVRIERTWIAGFAF